MDELLYAAGLGKHGPKIFDTVAGQWQAMAMAPMGPWLRAGQADLDRVVESAMRLRVLTRYLFVAWIWPLQ